MKNDRETVIYYEKSPTTPTIFGGLWGWMEYDREDWGVLENKIDNLCEAYYLSGGISREFIYSTVFCPDSKRLYHVFGYPGIDKVSLVFVYVPGFQKNLTEKVKEELVKWIKDDFSTVRNMWELMENGAKKDEK